MIGLCRTEGDAPDPDIDPYEETDSEEDESSCSTSTITDLPALPNTLTKARKLLVARAFVNIRDYMDERRKSKNGPTARKPGVYAHLVFHDEKAMKKYTSENGRYIKLKAAKEAWLQPLLRQIHTRGRRY